MGKVFSGHGISFNNGGRVIVLFLLYLLALWEFYTMGITGLALICSIPIIFFAFVIALRWPMMVFWVTFVANYFVMYLNKMHWMPAAVPVSAVVEVCEIICIVVALCLHDRVKFHRLNNLMLVLLLVWCFFCCLEMFNDTCGLGFNFKAWYSGARLMAFQLLYALIVCILYIDSPQRLNRYLKVWAVLCIISVVYCFKQVEFGFNYTELAWLNNVGYSTHRVNGILRYWSTFNDAASFGCCMAASAAMFFSIGVFSRKWSDRIFFILTGVLCVWGFFQSGTRTAVVAFAAGVMTFVILSKSVKMALPTVIFGGFFFAILVFTNIGQGNHQIRRMRSAFKKNDASMGVREYNKAQLAKYLHEAPWGLGIGMDYDNVPPFNKYTIASRIPPDSEYVFIWVHTGKIGITVFTILQVLIFAGGCWIVLFRLRNKTLRGIGAGFCSAFMTIQLAAYVNQILMQFPNCLMFYGCMAVCYTLPFIEKDYEAYEEQCRQLEAAKREEKERKKRESRV